MQPSLKFTYHHFSYSGHSGLSNCQVWNCHCLCERVSEKRWLFPSPQKKDTPILPSAVSPRLHTLLEHAGCEQVRFHDLGTPLLPIPPAHGMNIKILSTVLMHPVPPPWTPISCHRWGAAKSVRPSGNSPIFALWWQVYGQPAPRMILPAKHKTKTSLFVGYWDTFKEVY